MKEIVGNLDATGLKMALVVSRFNSFFTEQLVKGAADCFVRHGGKEENLTLVRVPGANELPQVAQRLAAAGQVDAVIALGAVIQGATPHADLINGTVARALAKIALDTGVPVLNGIVCALNLEQAIERAGTKQGNKGWDAVAAAIETVNVLKAL
ncbi:MAG TPA: 6,7-dimethyl-8-ribityllumazine synthase [Kiritimatiellia bacterium]|jgi:6,7-dimethyl-8-ribityllumazine synthase|nr:MAG: 6,7-dimethyl-8-ribityllumazine synthase [Verrucomicrobia bacterium ADurb.Bin070]HPB09612.1 6,7-dimethyl-8-ribityllumazine synthase [Kiritimatiellia bacterium]HQA37957.1 6,7-dimethyl-8-ribityllumazine synthase [Kiritimatiellia bacterium]HQA37966.1 6,7-dimethyl-8-ribityllumazine synthase [Kiritimatiellia bacterium]HQL51970.1 6,7-dimethyl-8-ribityllumazine synthase [Kiritimatiellia bacterium]